VYYYYLAINHCISSSAQQLGISGKATVSDGGSVLSGFLATITHFSLEPRERETQTTPKITNITTTIGVRRGEGRRREHQTGNSVQRSTLCSPTTDSQENLSAHPSLSTDYYSSPQTVLVNSLSTHFGHILSLFPSCRLLGQAITAL